MTQACDLRKDEPHPVASLAAAAKFGAHTVVNGVLGVDESLEIVRVVHDKNPQLFRNDGLGVHRERDLPATRASKDAHEALLAIVGEDNGHLFLRDQRPGAQTSAACASG